MKLPVFAALLASGSVMAAPPINRPRLVLVISIDQFRADYVDRFSDHYLPSKNGGKVGGFRYLSELGAFYSDAHHTHIPTSTGPGHATILTGSVPALDGIVENEWYNRDTKKEVYCVEDPLSETVGGPSKPMSARNLLVSTVGDELKMATNGKAKVVGISFKDRAAILMAGHAADTVIWFDGGNGAWVTSTFFAPNKQLPAWVTEINSQGRPAAELGKVWTPLLPDKEYAFAHKPPFAKNTKEAVFSHSTGVAGGKSFSGWTTSAYGQQYVFDTVKTAIDKEQLGQDETPDILAVNLATNDYVGHAYGPNSAEVMDISIRTDRMLSDLFNSINKQVPGGLKNVTIVLTADHGVLPITEEAHDLYRLPAERIAGGAVKRAIETALDQQFGEADWVESDQGVYVYLNQKTIAEKKVDPNLAASVAAKAASTVSGVFGAVTANQVLTGALPRMPWAQMVTNGMYPKRSGDVIVLENPGSYPGGGNGTGHGSPWAYDSHVPILLSGFGISRGVNNRTVAVSDIASTLCRLLGIEQPTGNIGQPLREALGSGK